MRRKFLLALALTLGVGSAALACDICTAGGPMTTFSQQIAKAKCVVFASVVNARPNAAGGGNSDLRIETVVKDHEHLKDKTKLTVNRFIPPDAKVKWLFFLDLDRGQWDPFSGLPFNSDRIVKYLQDARPSLPKGKPEERAGRLKYFFAFLNDKEPELAMDAYKEWAMASNAEVGLAAPSLSAEQLRAWFLDRNTPAERLSLYGFLLGACGTDKDADMLQRFIRNPDDRTSRALEGMLAGYIQLRPADGWKAAMEIGGNGAKPFTQRHAVLRMLRFYYDFQPTQSRDKVLQCTALMLKQDDFLDVPIDDLRIWKLWDHTDLILDLFPKFKGVPIVKTKIIRYALCCPLPQAKKFVDQMRLQDPDEVKRLQEDLEYEGARRGSNAKPGAPTRGLAGAAGVWFLVLTCASVPWLRPSRGPCPPCLPADPTRSTIANHHS